MSGADAGVKLHEIPFAAPGISFIAQEVMDLVRFISVEAPGLQRHVHRAGLGSVRVEVNDGKDDIGQVVRMLAIANYPVVIGRVEPQVPVAPEGGVLAAGAVNTAD